MQVLMGNPLTMNTILGIIVFVFCFMSWSYLGRILSWNASFVCIPPSFISRGDAEVLAWLKVVLPRNESECGWLLILFIFIAS